MLTVGLHGQEAAAVIQQIAGIAVLLWDIDYFEGAK
jgi:hypothetical protein